MIRAEASRFMKERHRGVGYEIFLRVFSMRVYRVCHDIFVSFTFHMRGAARGKNRILSIFDAGKSRMKMFLFRLISNHKLLLS